MKSNLLPGNKLTDASGIGSLKAKPFRSQIVQQQPQNGVREICA